MGRTKDFMNEETMDSKAGYSIGGRSKRAQHFSLGQSRPTSQQSEPTIKELFKQLLTRWHRTWVAVKFKFHQLTFGLFKNKIGQRVAYVLLVAWFAFGRERHIEDIFLHPVQFVWGESPSQKRSSQTIAARQEVLPTESESKPRVVKNDAAPVSVNDLQEKQALEYIERFRKVAIAEQQKFGIPASISLAQGLVESRAGQSTLAKKNNNHFGMKCFSKKCRKGHCSNFTDDHHKDFFIIYGNAWESWRAHSQMLASGRYSTLKKHGNDYKKWAYGLKSLGYATDANYAEKLISMIEKYDLQKLDNE